MPAQLNLPATSSTPTTTWACAVRLHPPSVIPARAGLQRVTQVCGVFKVPTLRNVALTAPYFHNGSRRDLHMLVQFYVTRDINNNTGNNPLPVPAGPTGNPYQAVGTFYDRRRRQPDLYQYNDLPVAFDASVNAGENPYTPAARFAGGDDPDAEPAARSTISLRSCARSPTATTRLTRRPTTSRRSVSPDAN